MNSLLSLSKIFLFIIELINKNENKILFSKKIKKDNYNGRFEKLSGNLRKETELSSKRC